ncbi:MAG: PDDEXK nuclease domain-containing protein [Phormidesmis sp.]
MENQKPDSKNQIPKTKNQKLGIGQTSEVHNDAYVAFLSELKTRIRTAQLRAVQSINTEVTLLYWEVGRDILQRQVSEGWGSKVVSRLSKDLKREFPDMKGFSTRNLNYMRKFAEAYPDREIVQRSAAQIPWRHNQVLLEKLKDREKRLWYAQQSLESGWSRDILIMQIESDLYQRQGGAFTNFERTLPKPESDLAQQMIKSPYNFDFLSLGKEVQERELEKALVEHIREFLIELGVGFAFVGSQYRLEVEGDEFFIDLLFYRFKLRRFIVIDLKTTDFKPEYAGKMNFYVAAVDDTLRHPDDNPTIGMVLCRSSKSTIVEYALRDVNTPIAVSSHQLPEQLKDSLPTPDQLEMELESAAKAIEAQHQLSE